MELQRYRAKQRTKSIAGGASIHHERLGPKASSEAVRCPPIHPYEATLYRVAPSPPPPLTNRWSHGRTPVAHNKRSCLSPFFFFFWSFLFPFLDSPPHIIFCWRVDVPSSTVLSRDLPLSARPCRPNVVRHLVGRRQLSRHAKRVIWPRNKSYETGFFIFIYFLLLRGRSWRTKRR